MPKCSVKWCKSHTDLKNVDITFHSFPTNELVKRKWIAAVRLERQEDDWIPSKSSRICSIHFQKEDISAPTACQGRHRLNKQAVPICTMVSSYSQVSQQTQIIVAPLSQASLPKMNKEDVKPAGRRHQSPIESKLEFVVCTPRIQYLNEKLKKKTLLTELRLTKIKNLRRRNKRLLKKYITLKDVTDTLKHKEFGNSNLQTALSGFSSDMCVLEKQTSRKGRSIVKFTAAIKKFALTLNYYSPAGYKFVRRQLLSYLPRPSTVSKWYQTVDGKPGFTDESFRALKSKFDQSDKRLACLIVNEMAISQQRNFNGKDVDGLVTYGPPEEMATQVYVLMLVSFNDSFKLPLGYFFINGLAAEQRCNIIKMCLTKCHEVGAEVVSLTFDGSASNFATAKMLGCKFEADNMKTFFEHPETRKPVFLFLDVCYMVKLVRNVLETKKTLIDKDGKKVQWKYLENLKNMQENIGLHFGNKMTQRHLAYRNKIMNVNLETQTLNNSVAAALRLCSNELKLPAFQDSNATINFIEIINDLFGLFNTRSINDHDYELPIKLYRKESCLEFLNSCYEYLRQLKINVWQNNIRKVKEQKVTEFTSTQKLLICTISKTGFLGLLICITSFKMLFTELVEKRKVIEFILPYKFSLDHLELFFGVIRNHGRCNNNPNARQFTEIYKKMLFNLELRSKYTGNCIQALHYIALENIPILNCSSAINKTTPGFRHKFQDNTTKNKNTELTTEKVNCMVLSQTLDVDRLLPETVEQIVGYIGGFVVKKMQTKLECQSCFTLLQADEKLYFHKLISMKDSGGLVYPSIVLFKICFASETMLRQILKIYKQEKGLIGSSNLRVLTHKCFSKISEKRDILNAFRQNHDHESSHDVLLIKAVIEEFLKIRLLYMAKNESLLSSCRQKVNKLVILKR